MEPINSYQARRQITVFLLQIRATASAFCKPGFASKLISSGRSLTSFSSRADSAGASASFELDVCSFVCSSCVLVDHGQRLFAFRLRRMPRLLMMAPGIIFSDNPWTGQHSQIRGGCCSVVDVSNVKQGRRGRLGKRGKKGPINFSMPPLGHPETGEDLPLRCAWYGLETPPTPQAHLFKPTSLLEMRPILT